MLRSPLIHPPLLAVLGAAGHGLINAPNYWIDAINGAVILFALILARIIGGEATAE